jgi:hypothetical protein
VGLSSMVRELPAPHSPHPPHPVDETLLLQGASQQTLMC